MIFTLTFYVMKNWLFFFSFFSDVLSNVILITMP